MVPGVEDRVIPWLLHGEDSFARVKKDLEEGYRLGVISTPTYYVNGTEIAWVEDKVMEDFLRTLFPMTKTIPYEPRK